MNLLTWVPSLRATCSAFRATSCSLAKYGKVYFSHLSLEHAAANQLAGRPFVCASPARRSNLSRCPSLMSFLYRFVLARIQKSEPVMSALIAAGSSIEVLLVTLPTVSSIELLSVSWFCLKAAYLACSTAPADSVLISGISSLLKPQQTKP